MNLHSLAGPIVAAVNPWTSAVYSKSTGSTTAPSGKRTPAYAPGLAVQIQVQALSWKDTQQLSGLNLNGERRAIYVSGDWQGTDRPGIRGGDKIALADGTVWLVVQSLENWNTSAGWAKVAATKQDGS